MQSCHPPAYALYVRQLWFLQNIYLKNGEIVIMKKLFISHINILVLLLTLFIMTCKNESKPEIIKESFPAAQAEIREVIKSIVSDAETANIDGLKSAHLVSDKFTKFGPRNFNRQDVISTNNSEEEFFGTISDYKQEIKDLKIDVFGDIGIATYYPHVSFVQNGVEKIGSGRQTLVFLKTDNGWKIIHEHGTPKQ
jgi:ketosteroid isomerase-like protein